MRTFRTAWLVVCCALASAGIAAASMSAPLVLCVVFGAAAAVAVVAGWWLARPGAAPRLGALTRAFAYAGVPYAPVPPYLDLHLFTDEQLCEAWRASDPALLNRTSVKDVMQAVDERQTYLDELLRRHPAAMTAWLSSEPGAEDPLTRPGDRSHQRPGIDWDELIPGQDW
jgi:hypothetical protein